MYVRMYVRMYFCMYVCMYSLLKYPDLERKNDYIKSASFSSFKNTRVKKSSSYFRVFLFSINDELFIYI